MVRDFILTVWLNLSRFAKNVIFSFIRHSNHPLATRFSLGVGVKIVQHPQEPGSTYPQNQLDACHSSLTLFGVSITFILSSAYLSAASPSCSDTRTHIKSSLVSSVPVAPLSMIQVGRAAFHSLGLLVLLSPCIIV